MDTITQTDSLTSAPNSCVVTVTIHGSSGLTGFPALPLVYEQIGDQANFFGGQGTATQDPHKNKSILVVSRQSNEAAPAVRSVADR